MTNFPLKRGMVVVLKFEIWKYPKSTTSLLINTQQPNRVYKSKRRQCENHNVVSGQEGTAPEKMQLLRSAVCYEGVQFLGEQKFHVQNKQCFPHLQMLSYDTSASWLRRVPEKIAYWMDFWMDRFYIQITSFHQINDVELPSFLHGAQHPHPEAIAVDRRHFFPCLIRRRSCHLVPTFS